MSESPRGTVAFLFTDIDGSTRLWQAHRPAMERAYQRHDQILRAAIAAHGGVVYKVVGDAVQAAFPTAPGAVAAALETQLSLAAQDWADLGLPEELRVRMALHAGDVDPDPDGDYRSPVLNRLGRLMGAGHGCQTLLSQAVRQLARDRLPEGADLRDLGEHRLKDLLEPERVWQLLHPALDADFPSLKTLESRSHNLPLQPTPVIGRERQVTELAALLRRDDVRLVTLTGPGGTGKTRLGLQVAAEVVEDFPDGVWFVPLAALTDPALVPSAIAEVLGVRESGGSTMRDQVASYLREKRLLLVLDNFEQVLEAAPLVGGLLVAPGISVLVTSRAPLRLRGEREIPVPPLGLPRRKPPPTLAQIGQYEAVRLFIERAQDVRPDFAVTNATAPAVAEICHRLDGLPLAIELAAARVRLFTPQAMLERMANRLPLLTGGARDAPVRQQTLRGAIAWSYDLLEPDEQKLFRRLSVFTGGWTIEAAEAVVGSPGSNELALDVLDGLERLTQHSLVRQAEGVAGEPRFTMLETIREYGGEHLHRTGEGEEARERHVAFFLAWAEDAQPSLRGPDQGDWFDRLETEHDNLRAALAWALAHDPAAALRLAAAIWRFWEARGYLGEGLSWLERALAADAGGPSVARVRALIAMGNLASFMDDVARAGSAAEEALALARALGDRVGEMRALGSFATIVAGTGDWSRGISLAEDALRLARELGDQHQVMLTLSYLGHWAGIQGDWSRAATLLTEALAAKRSTGDRAMTSSVLHSLGRVARRRGDPVAATEAFRDALIEARAARYDFIVPDTLGGLAGVAVAADRATAAVRLLGAEAALRAAMGRGIEAEERDDHARDVTAARAALGEVGFTTAWDAGGALSLQEAVAEALALADELARDLAEEHGRDA